MSDPRHDEMDESLVEVAAAVADQTPVDWSSEQSRTPRNARVLERLREIAALQEAHARLGAGPASRGALFTWGALEVLEPIGAGSFAEVYRAWDRSLEREVALKLRRQDAGRSTLEDRRWIEEARRLARVKHPNVLAVFGADTHDGRAGLWTELLSGQTLEQWITARGALGPREAQAVGIELCAALAAVHATGLVHGDVTTRNVMRAGVSGSSDGSGRIVLMDFGSAHDRALPELTTVGTPLFTAPEVLDGEPQSPRSDVYALGVVLYRLLTVRYPVEAGPVARIREQLRGAGRVSLRDARPDLPASLVQVVERAAAPDPAQRFAGASELERALAESLPARSVPRAATWARGVAVAAVVLLTAALAAVTWMRSRPTPATPAPVVTAPPVAPSPGGVAASEPAAPALRVEAVLFRTTAGSREALASGDMIGPGDALSLELTTSRPAHVYVLDEDRQGKVFALFPLRSRGASNPIAAGVRHRLPGIEQGRPLDWQVTSAGGKETILVLVSAHPLAPVEQAIAAIPQAEPGAEVSYPALAAETLARLRGVGGVTRGEPLQSDARNGILPALARDLSKRPGDSLWMRLIELENPVP